LAGAVPSREFSIPIFLWVATAILLHLLFGASSHTVAVRVEESEQVRRFTRLVANEAAREFRSVEITLEGLSDEHDDEYPPETESADSVPDEEEPELAQAQPKLEEPKKREDEEEKREEEKREEEKREEEKQAKVLEEKPAEKPPSKVRELLLEKQKRIAVRQHVEDKQQAPNPDAEFLGDHDNRVEEQTQARITSTDENDPNPEAGSAASEAAGEEPGNAERDRVASATGTEERGDANPSLARPEQPSPEPSSPELEPSPGSAERAAATAGRTPERGTPEPELPSTERAPVPPTPELLDGSEGRTAAALPPDPGSKPKKRLPPPKSGRRGLLGLGGDLTSPSGLNLNLRPRDALAVVGPERLREDRHQDHAHRKSQHAGRWKLVGLKRWRSAIENYIAHIKPGTATALNTAYSPFAAYLNAVHNRIHPIFADQFLDSLSQLPGDHPLNRQDLSTFLELVIDPEDGSLVTQGVVKPSGVTAFDVNALEAVHQASPFGPAPSAIVSYDGRVYLHWEFHRRREIACGTFNAHPYLRRPPTQPAPATPTPDPSPLPKPEHFLAPARGDQVGAVRRGTFGWF